MTEKRGGKDLTVKKFKEDATVEDFVMPDETAPLFEFDTGKDGEDTSNVLGQAPPPAGIGPQCRPGEAGTADKVQCMFEENKKCLSDYYQEVLDCLAAHGGESGGTYSGVARTEVYSDTKACEELADKRKEECKKRSQKKCKCPNSIYEFCIDPNGCDPKDPDDDDPPDDEPDDDDDDDTGDGSDGPRLSVANVTNSQYGVPINTIWGRYIVGGNCFWMSDLRKSSFTTNERPDADVSQPVSTAIETHYYFDMAVGICRGPATAVVRIWLADLLIYSGALPTDDDGYVINTNVSSEYNFGAIRPGDSTYTELDRHTPRFTLYGGTRNQKRNPVMAAVQGGVNTPAYRELAYLFVENFNIAYLKGVFPALRIEVYVAGEEAEIGVPRIEMSAHPDNLLYQATQPDLLALDVERNRLYVSGRDPSAAKEAVRVLDYSSLTEVIAPVPPEGRHAESHNTYVTKSGIVIMQSGYNPITPTHTFDVMKGIIHDSFGIDSSFGVGHLYEESYGQIGVPLKGSAMSSMLTYDANGLSREAIIVPAGGQDDFNVAIYDPMRRVLMHTSAYYSGETTLPTAGNSIAATVPGYIDSLGGTVRSEGWFVFSTQPGGSTSSIGISWVLLHSSASRRTHNTYFYPYAHDSIDAVHYGNETSVVTIPVVFPVLGTPSFILLVRTSSRSFLIRWNSEALSVEWSMEVPQYPVWSSSNTRRIGFPLSDFAYVAENNDVVLVDLKLVDFTVPFNLTDFDGQDDELPVITGAQLYDPREGTVTYISSTGVTKVFVTRRAAKPINLAYLLTDICVTAGVPREFVDASALVDTNVIGYAVTTEAPAQDVLRQLVEFFGVRAYERGDVLVFDVPPDASLIQPIDPIDFGVNSQDNTIMHEKRDASLRAERAAFTVADIDNFCDRLVYSINLEQNVDELAVANTIQREASLVVAPDVIVDAMLRVLSNNNLAASEYQFEAGPKYTWITPADVLQITLPDGVVYTGTVASQLTTMGAFTNRIVMRRYLTSIFDTYNPTYGVTAKTGAGVSTGGVSPGNFVYPFFIPAILDDHRTRESQWLVYTGVDAPGERFTQDVRPIFQVIERPDVGGRGYWDFPEKSRPNFLGRFRVESDVPVFLGTLLTPPNPVTNPLTEDTSSALIIRFDRASVVDRFVAGQTTAQLVEAPSTNLLIVGRELIQFKNWTVDADGRTIMFTNLLRGRRGTDGFAQYHPTTQSNLLPTREICALYTPDSIKPSQHGAALATGFYNVLASENVAVFTGGDGIPRKFYAPGDSLRFPPPGDVSRFDYAHTPTASTWDLEFRWNRRKLRTLNEVDAGSVDLETNSEQYVFMLVSGNTSGPDIAKIEEYLRSGSTGGGYIKFTADVTTPEYILQGFVGTSLGLSAKNSTYYVVVLQRRFIGTFEGYHLDGMVGYSIFKPDVAYPLP